MSNEVKKQGIGNYESACKVIARVVYWRKAYEDSNPEIGLPPSWEGLFMDAVDGLGLSFSNADMLHIIDMAKTGRCFDE